MAEQFRALLFPPRLSEATDYIRARGNFTLGIPALHNGILCVAIFAFLPPELPLRGLFRGRDSKLRLEK